MIIFKIIEETKPLSRTFMVIMKVTSAAHYKYEHSLLSNECLASSSRWLKFVDTVVCESRKSL